MAKIFRPAIIQRSIAFAAGNGCGYQPVGIATMIGMDVGESSFFVSPVISQVSQFFPLRIGEAIPFSGCIDTPCVFVVVPVVGGVFGRSSAILAGGTVAPASVGPTLKSCEGLCAFALVAGFCRTPDLHLVHSSALHKNRLHLEQMPKS